MTQPQLKLYNTLTREKEIFKPLDIDAEGNAQSVRMYVCGITPYDYAHIGNLRTIVVFDVLYRLLRHLYPAKEGKETVEYVRNYTDIDDKIVQRAAERGMDPFALSNEFIGIFERDMARMNVLDLPREQKPRVSDYMRQIVAMVNGLLEKGFAYVTASGDVMLDVVRFNDLGGAHKPFGYLERRTFDNLQARVEEDAEKRDPRDFPIWKANSKSATKMEQAFLPVELGATYAGFDAAGRPGWHIECSVMSEELLGKNYRQGHAALFDIHGGGEDLKFPHHSCEIAQTEAFHPECTMSSVWMHVAFLTVEGQKMSKSLGNFVLIDEAISRFGSDAVRLWLLQTNYGNPVDYSEKVLSEARDGIRKIYNILENAEEILAEDRAESEIDFSNGYVRNAVEGLSDNLNTAVALASVHGLLNQLRKAVESADAQEIKLCRPNLRFIMTDLLGIASSPVKEFIDPAFNNLAETSFVNEILQARINARTAKNWTESDRLRDLLKTEHGIIVEDGPNGQTWRRV